MSNIEQLGTRRIYMTAVSVKVCQLGCWLSAQTAQEVGSGAMRKDCRLNNTLCGADYVWLVHAT
jgi:hypothetical protein